jgi:molybdopterin-biosynthesis enzyme MoeA-like protein
MSSINIMADKLKSKVNRSSTYILPLRVEVVKRFGQLESELADKTERLNKATRSYLEVKKTVDEMSSLLDQAEVTADTCTALEAEQSFEELEVCVS